MYEEASLPGKGCGVVATREISPGQCCHQYFQNIKKHKSVNFVF